VLRAERAAIRSARLAICNSNRTRSDAIEKLGVAPQRAVTVYYGTDPDQFPLITGEERAAARARLGWDDRPRGVFVGALGDTRKGFDTLYAAWRDLCRESSWDASLAVVGAGATLDAWRDRAAADGLEARISFLGFRTDVPDILAAADLLIHPARYEAYGLAPHEALCRGLPTIVSAIAGVSERYPPDLADLILTDPENPAELAERLRHWRANRESLAVRVRPLADELRARTWADMARDIRNAIRDT
jgi:glycosyltransferase involved in cell wall biosynthesis